MSESQGRFKKEITKGWSSGLTTIFVSPYDQPIDKNSNALHFFITFGFNMIYS